MKWLLNAIVISVGLISVGLFEYFAWTLMHDVKVDAKTDQKNELLKLNFLAKIFSPALVKYPLLKGNEYAVVSLLFFNGFEGCWNAERYYSGWRS